MWSPWTLETKIIAKLKAEIKALRQYPNVMAFFGHCHRNCADELNLWQGEYTVVHVPSTSYCCTRGGGVRTRSPYARRLVRRPWSAASARDLARVLTGTRSAAADRAHCILAVIRSVLELAFVAELARRLPEVAIDGGERDA